MNDDSRIITKDLHLYTGRQARPEDEPAIMARVAVSRDLFEKAKATKARSQERQVDLGVQR